MNLYAILNHYLIQIILIIIGTIFSYYYWLWVKSNKLLYSILPISILMISLKKLSLNKLEIDNLNFIFDIGLSMLSAFIFYFITVILKEKKRNEYYSFYSLDFLLNFHKLLSHFYVKEIFKKLTNEEIEKTEFDLDKLKVELPTDKIYEIIKNSKNISQNILEELDIQEKSLKKQKKEILDSIQKEKKERKDDKSSSLALEYWEKEIMSEQTYIYDIYIEICKKSEKFLNRLSYNFMAIENFEEINNIHYILNYFEKNLNGDNSQIKYFIKNYEHMEDELKGLIDNNIAILKAGKKYIPKIEIQLTNDNFGILNEKIIYEIIRYFYEYNPKIYKNIRTGEKKKIHDIINENGKYYFNIEGEKIRIKDLSIKGIIQGNLSEQYKTQKKELIYIYT